MHAQAENAFEMFVLSSNQFHVRDLSERQHTVIKFNCAVHVRDGHSHGFDRADNRYGPASPLSILGGLYRQRNQPESQSASQPSNHADNPNSSSRVKVAISVRALPLLCHTSGMCETLQQAPQVPGLFSAPPRASWVPSVF